ncbi:cuticle protein 19-like [Wyeomyia smithii]|uniref:cuticle protein 19-like n=1 Tax=Wyeomyia smithii TaxID=174621 RepID=UPI002467FECA|nr:cuticle protein 19-like [Wyeomyia smithii]
MFRPMIFLALMCLAAAEIYKEDFAHPKYKFQYGVKDFHTGDSKDQWEHRDGDIVRGQYTLYEADGTKRVVEYTSDKHKGFQAHVKRVGHAQHPQLYSSDANDQHFVGSKGHASSYANLYQQHH